MFETAVAKTAAILVGLLIAATTVTIGARKSVGLAVLTFVFLIPGFLLSVFDINCTAAGQCFVWSWIKTVSIVLTYVSLLVIAIVSSSAAKSAEAVAATAASTPATATLATPVAATAAAAAATPEKPAAAATATQK